MNPFQFFGPDRKPNSQQSEAPKSNVSPFRRIEPVDTTRILAEEQIEPDAYLEMPHTPESISLKEEEEWNKFPVPEKIVDRFKAVARDKGAFDLARDWSRQEMTLEERVGRSGISLFIYLTIFVINGILLYRAFEDITQGLVIFFLLSPGQESETTASFVLAGVLGLMVECILASILFVRVTLRLDYECRIKQLEEVRKENLRFPVLQENLLSQIYLARRYTADERRKQLNPFDILWGLSAAVGLSIDWLAVLKVLTSESNGAKKAVTDAKEAVTFIQWESCTIEHYVIASISVVIILMTSGLLGYFLYLPKAKNTVASRFQDYVRSVRPFQLQSDIELNNRLHRRFLSDPKMQQVGSPEELNQQFIIYSQRHEARFYRECIGRLQSNLYKQKVRVMSTEFKDDYERDRILESLTIECKLKVREFEHRVKELEFELKSSLGAQWPDSYVPIFDLMKGDDLNGRIHQEEFNP
jgi:hypothetical protein